MVARHLPEKTPNKTGWLLVAKLTLGGMLIVFGLLLIVKQFPVIMPVRQIYLEGKFQYSNPQQLQTIINQYSGVGLLAIDLSQMQSQLQQLPWIKSVNIERRWPDRIRVNVTEKSPYLQLGNDKIISVDGAVFTPASTQQFSNLPMLNIDKVFTPTLFSAYREMEYMLAQHGFELKQFHVNKQGEWTLDLSNDVQIEIGHHKPLFVFERFIAVLPNLNNDPEKQLKSIDLRYENGFAIGFAE